MKLRDFHDAESIVNHLIVLLRDVLSQWRVQRRPLDTSSPGTQDSVPEQIGLYREYRFGSFEGAVAFMSSTVTGCNIMNHHPIWENIWRTVRIFLSTWDIDHRISDRDVQLAKYFARSYEDFPAADPAP